MDRLEYRCLHWNDEIVMVRVISADPRDIAEVSIFPKTRCCGPSVTLAWPFDSLCQIEDMSPRICLN